jgi:predicted RNA methylase
LFYLSPPFGTKNNEGIDIQFLKTAIRLARRAVYSFHKTSTRLFLMKLLRDKWGLNAEVVAEMKFDIPNMYKFHKQKCVDVDVDLLRIYWDEPDGDGDGDDVDRDKYDGAEEDEEDEESER